MQILIATALVIAVPSVAAAQVTINPKVGVSLSDMKDATDGVDTKGRLGYQVGADLRLGSAFFIQPGVHYQQTGLEIGGTTMDVRSVHVPVLFGIRLGAGVAGVRIVGGPAATFVRSVNDDPSGVMQDLLRERRIGGMLGAGVDVLGFSVDLTGEMGLDNFYRSGSDQKLRTFRLSAGLRF
ncbi:MAG: outer membrane beta-barrel protein [Gemmatimonadales bacterium]